MAPMRRLLKWGAILILLALAYANEEGLLDDFLDYVEEEYGLPVAILILLGVLVGVYLLLKIMARRRA